MLWRRARYTNHAKCPAGPVSTGRAPLHSLSLGNTGSRDPCAAARYPARRGATMARVTGMGVTDPAHPQFRLHEDPPRRRRRKPSQLDEDPVDHRTRPTDLELDLLEALGDLVEIHATVIRLRVLGCRTGEIAKALGLSMRGACKILAEGRRTLAVRLKPGMFPKSCTVDPPERREAAV